MPRQSKNLDKKMLKVGGAILKNKGVSKLSIRDVAKKAAVNLGMFNYYFNGKEEFIKKILEEVYAPFISDLESSKNCENTLEEVLFKMATFSRDHQEHILLLLGDVLTDEKTVIIFLKKNFTEHFVILSAVLEKHFETNNYKMQFFDHAFRYLISSVGIPNLLTSLKNKTSKDKQQPDSDTMLRCRVAAAINGLRFICPNFC